MTGDLANLLASRGPDSTLFDRNSEKSASEPSAKPLGAYRPQKLMPTELHLPKLPHYTFPKERQDSLKQHCHQ